MQGNPNTGTGRPHIPTFADIQRRTAELRPSSSPAPAPQPAAGSQRIPSPRPIAYPKLGEAALYGVAGLSRRSLATNLESAEGLFGFEAGVLVLVERCQPLRNETADEWLSLEGWRARWTAPSWRQYLAAGEMESQLAVIRQRTHSGRPCGSPEFVHGLEKTTHRRLAPQKRGPREKIVTDRSQPEFIFEP